MAVRPSMHQRFELRLSPRPVLAYSDESVGVIDGGVFIFTHGVTSPDRCNDTAIPRYAPVMGSERTELISQSAAV